MGFRYLGQPNIFGKLLGLSGAAPEPVLPITANLTLDLDARYGIFQDTAGSTPAQATDDPVGRWEDQAGVCQPYTAPTDGQRPLLKLSQINGKPGLLTDGVDDKLATVSVLSTLIAADAFTCYAVLQPVAVDTNSATVYQNDMLLIDGGGFWGPFFFKSGGTVHVYNFDGSVDEASASVTIGSWSYMQARHDAGSIYINVNGGSESTATSGNTTNLTNVAELNRRGSGAVIGNFLITRILMYNVAHTEVQRASMYTYLATLYGF